MTDDFPTRRAEMDRLRQDFSNEEDYGCMFLRHGHCETRSCYVRGGWDGKGPAKHIQPTCHTLDLRACLDAYDAMRERAETAERKLSAIDVILVKRERSAGDALQATLDIRRALTEES